MSQRIRDYIYLDIDRIRSMYAQISEGLVESIVETKSASEGASEELNDKNINLGNVSREVLLGSGKTGTRIMHDYLFTALEKKLERIVTQVSLDNIETIRDGMLIKVNGKVEIDDTSRMIKLIKNFNDVNAHLQTIGASQVIQEQLWNLEDQLETTQRELITIEDEIITSKSHTETKQLLEKKRKTLAILRQVEHSINELSPARIMRNMKQGVPSLIAQTMEKFYSLFYNDIFEIKILCPFNEDYVFRGILSREYFRENPELIYAKYGTRTQVHWTMMGQITSIYLPQFIGEKGNVSKQVDELFNIEQSSDNGSEKESHVDTPESETSDAPTPENNLRDAFEGLFNAMGKIEAHTVIPGTRKTWVLTPLAVFYETPI